MKSPSRKFKNMSIMATDPAKNALLSICDAPVLF